MANAFKNVQKLRSTSSVLDFGAVGDGQNDDTNAFVLAAATGRIIQVPPGNYIVKQSLTFDSGGLEGATADTTGSQRSSITFSGLTDTTQGAIKTRRATTKGGFVHFSNLIIFAQSWDPSTGALGYGLDFEAPVIAKDVYIFGFKRTGIWLHRANNGDGPYESLFTNCRSNMNGEYGVLIGNCANTVTFVNQQCKWNGAPSFNVAPTVPGLFDGFKTAATADGGTYGPSYSPENIRIIGGDCSYNSQYGWNIHESQKSKMDPGYAELNKVGGGFQNRVGDVWDCNINFTHGTGGVGVITTLDYKTVFSSYYSSNKITVNSVDLGGGTNAGKTTLFDFKTSTVKGTFARNNYFGYDTTTLNQTVIQSKIDGGSDFYSVGTGRWRFVGASGASGYVTPLYLGSFAMWVDSSGKLRIKDGTPTLDTDGTVVGTQA